MKALPFRYAAGVCIRCSPSEATHILLHLPGPFPNRMLPVITSGSRDKAPSPVWSWNADTEAPTLKPSILTRGKRDLTPAEVDRVLADTAPEDFLLPDIICHSWITDGNVIFLSDSTHEFANQTLPLLEVEE